MKGTRRALVAAVVLIAGAALGAGLLSKGRASGPWMAGALSLPASAGAVAVEKPVQAPTRSPGFAAIEAVPSPPAAPVVAAEAPEAPAGAHSAHSEADVAGHAPAAEPAGPSRGAGAGHGEEPKRELTQEEIQILWPYQPGQAVIPVLSPELRDIPPNPIAADPGGAIENRDLPTRGHRPTDAPARPDGAIQQIPGPSLLTATGVNFDGIPANGFAPPDNNGRVGPNHYVQWINVQFAIYDKSGTILYGPSAGNSLFTALGPSSPCVTHNDGDPLVVYDNLADRWILTQFAVDAPPTGQASYQCTAVSVTGDPLGAYYLYAFPLAPDQIWDYPHTAVWPDSYYAAYHVFNGAGTAFLFQGLVAFERAAMLAGLPARLVISNLSGNYFGALPADLDSLTPPPSGSPEYVFAPGSTEWDGTATPTLHVWTAATTWGATPATVVTGPTDMAGIASFNTDMCGFARACIPQPAPAAAGDSLDAISGRLMNRVAYRNFGNFESIVLSHGVNTSVSPANHGAPRWYEIRLPGGVPTIFQQGSYSPDTDHRWMPSVAMDNSGNIALGYSKSSTTVLPEIDVVGRLSTDAPGTLGTETVMKAGAGVQIGTVNRWGDYTAMTVDPRDGCTFWYTNQYQPANGSFNWHTRIGAFRFAPSECSAPAKGTLTGTVTDGGGAPIAGALVTLDNGFSGATNAAGVYSIVMPPGTANASASAPLRPGCTPSASAPVTVNNGAVTTRNFVLSGTADFGLGAVAVNDSAGNNNGVVNRNECVRLNVSLENIGCVVATGMSATLSTSTPGVTVVSGTSPYANTAPGATNAANFDIVTSPSLACGTPIAFSLAVTSASGSRTLGFNVATCAAPASVFNDAIVAGDPTQTVRLFRNGVASACGGAKACPGTSGAGTRHYKQYTFTNTAGTSRCVTVAMTPGCTAQGNFAIYSAAYLGSFNPANVCTNFLADRGVSDANGSTGAYSFDVPAGATFVVVVNEVNSGTLCTGYNLNVSGLLDTADGGRPAAPTAGSNGPICAGSTLNLTASTVPGATYSWTGPNGFTSSSQNPSISGATVAASGTYTVVATVGSCSSDPATTSVTVNPTPSAPTAGSNSPVVSGQTINLTASTVSGATYSWTGPNGFTSSSQNPSISGATAVNAGTYSVTATVGSCASAAGTTTVVITGMSPQALAVDPSGNGVFEPGETVSVNPTWRNIGSGSVSITGAFSSFTGPAGPTYTITDANGNYGALASGATTNCNTATSDCYRLTASGTRPALHWDTTVQETLSDATVKTWTLHLGNSFGDMPKTSPFYRFVETMFHRGVTAGCGAGNYCPASSTSREQMAVFVLVAKEGSGYTPPACTTPVFGDVPCSSPFARWINELSARGVVSGCGGGNYCPASPVARDQMAVFVLRTLDPALTPPACGTPSLFADVPASSGFCRYVEELARRGVVTGCGGGNYCPASPVTREQMGVFITVTFGLTLYGP